MERLAPLRREFPRLLSCGPNYIIIEYVGDGAAPPPKRLHKRPPAPLPLRDVRKLAELIRIIVANGFDPVDLRADGNVIYSAAGLKLIDFEFWQPCDPATPPEKSMCLAGISAENTNDRPRAGLRNLEPYRIGWYPYTLLNPLSFLYDRPHQQRFKRTVNFVRAYGQWVSRASLSTVARGIRRAGRATLKFPLALIGQQRRRSVSRRMSLPTLK